MKLMFLIIETVGALLIAVGIKSVSDTYLSGWFAALTVMAFLKVMSSLERLS